MKVYLDPEGSAAVPTGWRLVETEVEFLQAAFSQVPLVIRGHHLCRWAQEFYKGRDEPVEVLLSPAEALRGACPTLSRTQALALARRLGETLDDLSQPLTLQQIARALWPGDWWCEAPSEKRAAAWLLWWLETDPSEPEKVLLKALAQHYRQCASNVSAAVRDVYAVCGQQDAQAVLEAWLGLASPQANDWSEFPLELSEAAKGHLLSKFRSWVASNPERLLALFERIGVNRQLLPLAAETLALYYQQHPEGLTLNAFRRIDRYLTQSSRQTLRSLIPVPPPNEPPNEAKQLVTWYLNDYLPYRLWPRQDSNLIATRGRQFAESYLKLYSEAISGSADRELLSWMKAKNLKQPEQVTLLVVLDGLGYTDMRHFWGEMQRADVHGRLTLLNKEVAFGPLPSITSVAKPALLSGVTPRVAEHHPQLGPVLSKDKELEQALSNARAGELYIWRVEEPDSTYHSHNHQDQDTVVRMAHAALSGIVARLCGCIAAVPAELSLRLVITTDHGRLLATSRRTVAVPPGMTPHQRAALGRTQRRYPAEGYLIEGEVAYLDGQRFDIPEDCAIILSEASFLKQDSKAGVEIFPHGGIYPEEVLIPWWVIGRDVTFQALGVELVGRGVSGRRARLQIVLDNPNPVPVRVTGVCVSWQADTIDLTQVIQPLTKEIVDIDIAWPTRKQVANAQAYLHYRLPDGHPMQVAATISLESEEMYERENPLEDLL